jgi:hypothetical protein
VTTEPTPIQNEIARQIHVQKPAHLVPGRDVGMLLIPPLDGREAIAVHVLTDDTKAIVCYDAGRDTYVVSRQKFDEYEGGFDLMTPEEIENFLAYLRETLIPDLRTSGLDSTADDFGTCVEIIDGLL